MRLLLENLNAVIVLAGFVALEVGIAWQWSSAVAAIIGGGLVMLVGSLPYVRLMRKP